MNQSHFRMRYIMAYRPNNKHLYLQPIAVRPGVGPMQEMRSGNRNAPLGDKSVGRDKLKLGTAPKPVPSRHEVLVKVQAVSLNYRDKLTIDLGMGLPLRFPFVPASDMAGTVEAVGAEVTRFKPGDRVISVFSPDWRLTERRRTARRASRPTGPSGAITPAC